MRGVYLMERANRWTALRHDTSPIVGFAIAATDDTIWTSIATAAEIYSDYKDGKDARAGAALLGIETSLEGALSDPEADKVLVNSIMIGLFARYIRHRDFAGAAVVGANYYVSRWRDGNMEKNRALALLNNVDPKAIYINKVKTALQLASELALTGPASRNKACRNIGLVALSCGTALGVIGERVFRGRVKKAILKDEIAWARACPDTIPGPSG